MEVHTEYQSKTEDEKYIKRKKSFTENILRYLKQFCEFTSIQGPSYIVKNVSTSERIWWIAIFVLGLIGQCIMVYRIYEKYVTTPVLVSLATKEDMIRNIPFPAVTICPQAKVSHDCLNYTAILLARKGGKMLDTSPQENRLFDYMSLLCKSENHEGTFSIMKEEMNTTATGILDIMLHLGKGFFLDDYSNFLSKCTAVDLDEAICMWMGAQVECRRVLTPILTEKGLCYSFNMYDVRDIYSDLNQMKYFPESNRRLDWTPDNGYTETPENVEKLYPRRSLLNGAQHGFVAVFFIDKNDITYACEDFATQGMQVTLHTPTKIPRPERIFFTVGLDSLTNAAVIPTYTETSNRIKHYDPLKRFCFFGNERQLKYFKFYSQSNCNLECLVNYTIEHCECVSFYMPRDNVTKLCRLEDRFCLEESRRNYTEHILRENLEMGYPSLGCNCLPLCADLTYKTELSQTEWDWMNADEVELDSIRKNMSRYHASGVKIFFKTDIFLPTRRHELYGTTDLISNIGGILNLFVGVSLITSAEIIYFLSFKLLDNYYRYRQWIGP